MHETRTRADRIWLLCVSVAVAGLITLLLLWLLAPPSSARTISQSRKNEEKKILGEIANAKQRNNELNAKVAALTWGQDPEQIGPVALAGVTKRAKAAGLKLVGFRPQRTVEAGGLTQHPYLISLEGPFPAVLSFARELETPANRFAVTLVQVAAADGASDTVRATVGVVAFRQPSAASQKGT